MKFENGYSVRYIMPDVAGTRIQSLTASEDIVSRLPYREC
jgi:hypothetical protein